ncbi:MauE/DoxX family redox-associated membrane protein [Pontibacter liquoris]|uniref:MauE/DoxX family redox-associated membrane protein n=1 Tax=Pontibacter liquoris TaxID=2905677 RepID=UPI001FA74766|nr:MauE/DoxX family redox-associated membrane protein [Pontibacter liquoris]
MKSRNLILAGSTLALVALWVYAAVSKLQEFELFREQLLRQPFPAWLAGWLVWLVPLAELAATGLLLFRRTRGWGLIFSVGLLALFTGYVGLALAGVWEQVPCACGGIIGRLGWQGHFWFNLFFTLLAAGGLVVWKQKRRRASGGDAASGEAAYRSGGR